MYRDSFSDYIFATNVAGSKKAASYIRALDLLGEMLSVAPLGFEDCLNIWAVSSIERLEALYAVTNQEKLKGDASIWHREQFPPSYLQKGYCTAALRKYLEFLAQHLYTESLLDTFSHHQGSSDELVPKLKRKFVYPSCLLEVDSKKEGRDVIRRAKTRANQNVFREMILKVYDDACCISGLNIKSINRASHIIPWSEDQATRLDPTNGLCLSATYDVAFDSNLLSLDEDYRIILSKDLKEHYTNDSVKEVFLNREGQQIRLPASYQPKQSYLEIHRKKGRY